MINIILLHQIDDDGYYIEDIVTGRDDYDKKYYIDIHPNNNIQTFKLKFNRETNEWEEGLSQEEVNAILEKQKREMHITKDKVDKVQELENRIQELESIINKLIGGE